MSANPVAVRVAHRHQAATVHSEPFKIRLPNPGRITGDDVARALEPRFGQILDVQFHDTMTAGFGELAWEAKPVDGALLTGMIHLRSVFSKRAITSWAEVTIDARSGDVR